MTAHDIDTQEHIGHRLRARREGKGLSVSELAKALKIQPKFITAIEGLKTEELPSIGYVLGYVRSYASYVGLDGKDTVTQFKIATEVPDNLGLRDRPHFIPQRNIRLPKGFVPAILTLTCAAGVYLWYSTMPIPDGSQSRFASALETVTPKTANAETQTAENAFVIKTIAPSWVQLRDINGNIIMSRIMVSGESWSTPQDAGVTVSARDGGALELYRDGELVGPMGKRGVPFSGRPLMFAVESEIKTENLTVLTLANAE